MRVGAGAAGAQGQRERFPSSPKGLFCHVEELARVPSAKGGDIKGFGAGTRVWREKQRVHQWLILLMIIKRAGKQVFKLLPRDSLFPVKLFS